jgi:hypothetical protein
MLPKRTTLSPRRIIFDVPSQPRRLDRIDGPVCRSDTLVSIALWLGDSLARPPPDLMAGVTAHPSAEWIARQLAEACGWEWTPSYIVRDRDRVYGEIFTRRLPDTRNARSALSLAMTFDPMVLKKSHVHGARFQVIHGATGV